MGARATSIFKMAIFPELNASDRSVRLAKLRESYDTAFRELVLETRLLQSTAQNPVALADVSARIEHAAGAVRQRRDVMADFLLMGDQEHLTQSRVQQAAYFVWLNAGCPSGTSTSDWFTAQRQAKET